MILVKRRRAGLPPVREGGLRARRDQRPRAGPSEALPSMGPRRLMNTTSASASGVSPTWRCWRPPV